MKKKQVHVDYLQCGYEYECAKKNCMKCRKCTFKTDFSLNLAEQVAIEDFAMCDLKAMLEEKPKQVDILQDLMRNVMRKMFASESRSKKK